MISAFWIALLAFIILFDVGGRYLFGTPLLGATEIIKNSVVSIAFLQLPLAIYRGGMLRTTLLFDSVNPNFQRHLQIFGSVIGLLFFMALSYSSWTPFLESLQVGEYEGEGALRVPTYPVRFLIVLTAAFASLVYLHMIYLDWSGKRDTELSGSSESI